MAKLERLPASMTSSTSSLHIFLITHLWLQIFSGNHRDARLTTQCDNAIFLRTIFLQVEVRPRVLWEQYIKILIVSELRERWHWF